MPCQCILVGSSRLLVKLTLKISPTFPFNVGPGLVSLYSNNSAEVLSLKLKLVFLAVIL